MGTTMTELAMNLFGNNNLVSADCGGSFSRLYKEPKDQYSKAFTAQNKTNGNSWEKGINMAETWQRSRLTGALPSTISQQHSLFDAAPFAL